MGLLFTGELKQVEIYLSMPITIISLFWEIYLLLILIGVYVTVLEVVID